MKFVFYLHDVSSLQDAERMLMYFYKRYSIVSSNNIQDIISNNSNNQVVLTIDDGWKSTYDYFFPICKKYNIPITIFISPKSTIYGENLWFYTLKYCNVEKIQRYLIEENLFDEKIKEYPIDLVLKELQIDLVYDIINMFLEQVPPRGFCNIDEIREMHDSGLVTIGAHTLSHPILSNESIDRSSNEIISSIRFLEDIIQDDVTTFAYPNGIRGLDFDQREANICKQNGIKYAFSVDPGVLINNVDMYSIPRCGSINRLKFGKIGMYLPSIYDQLGKRLAIKKLKLSR